MIRNLTCKDNSRYRAVFFDLDGTITASGDGAIKGFRYMFDKIGHQEKDENKLRLLMGPPLKMHLMHEYGFSEEDAATAYGYFKEYYLNKGIFENRLYDGIKDAILDISRSGKKVYVATSKPEPQALSVLRHFEILDLFSEVFAARHDLGVYYKNDVLERAVRSLDQAPDEAVMVGDRLYDVLGGRHVGFDTVGVLYGYGDFDELRDAGCDFIVDSAEDLSLMLGRNDE
ncbi:MAG: HAD hydrolase-like protein [Eubacteriales bacterium]|nr:HAD hydrolase-like protein [Eubacteriales bacterium]